MPVAATAQLAINGFPSVGGHGLAPDTIQVGSRTAAFSGGVGFDNEIGPINVPGQTAADVTALIAGWVNANSEDCECSALRDGDNVFLTANAPGAAGNSITLATDSFQIGITPFSGGSD